MLVFVVVEADERKINDICCETQIVLALLIIETVLVLYEYCCLNKALEMNECMNKRRASCFRTDVELSIRCTPE